MNHSKLPSDRWPRIKESVDEIGFQTSILALQAALESAVHPDADDFRNCRFLAETLSMIESCSLATQVADVEKNARHEELCHVAARLRRMNSIESTSVAAPEPCKPPCDPR